MWMNSGIFSRLRRFCDIFTTWFPRVVVSSLLTWAECGTIIELHRQFGISAEYVFVTLAVSLLYILSIHTYFKIIIVGAGSPLDYEELRKDSRKLVGEDDPYNSNVRDLRKPHLQPLIETETSRLPPQEFLTSHTLTTREPAFRWCHICEVWKPDRCHHCSSCGRCFLKMDHHCPWFSCCIGFKNQKFFVQDLVYITAFCGAVCITSTYLLYTFFANQQYEHAFLSLNTILLFVVSLAFLIALGVFVAFSFYLMLKNYTTIEFQDMKGGYLGDRSGQYEYDQNGKKKQLGHIFDLGMAKNFKIVMGHKWYQWILPIGVTDSSSIYSDKNGLNFEVQEDLFEKYRYNAQLSEQLNQQLAEYRDRVTGTTRPTEGTFDS